MHTIRVVNYLGDYDDLDEVVIIGPYNSAAERNAALQRLARLPGVDGNLDLQPSTSNPLHADYSATAWQVAAATSLEDLEDAIWALR